MQENQQSARAEGQVYVPNVGDEVEWDECDNQFRTGPSQGLRGCRGAVHEIRSSVAATVISRVIMPHGRTDWSVSLSALRPLQPPAPAQEKRPECEEWHGFRVGDRVEHVSGSTAEVLGLLSDGRGLRVRLLTGGDYPPNEEQEYCVPEYLTLVSRLVSRRAARRAALAGKQDAPGSDCEVCAPGPCEPDAHGYPGGYDAPKSKRPDPYVAHREKTLDVLDAPGAPEGVTGEALVAHATDERNRERLASLTKKQRQAAKQLLRPVGKKRQTLSHPVCWPERSYDDVDELGSA